MPKTSKGARRAIEVACVAWLDLLGYGSQLRECLFDPTSAGAHAAVERLHQFHLSVASKANRTFHAFVMNDGAVLFRDLSPRTNNVSYEFLTQAVDLYQHINTIERSNGFPGARMVIATGFRIRSRAKPVPSGIGKAVLAGLQAGTKTIDSALRELLWARPVFGMIPELQANFAFTKAFLADHGGSRVGLGGPNCYIDIALFSTPSPDWVRFSKIVPWEDRGLSAEFGLLDALNQSNARSCGHQGIRDAFEVAEQLSTSPNTVAEIRKARLRDSIRPKPI
jgi:hypothetical protein